MHRITAIVQDCIDGCTALNADETKMHFNINYYVNSAFGQGEKFYCFVYDVNELEQNLYNIIRDNINKDVDVVITDITIKFKDKISRVNKSNYSYSLDYFMELLLRR